MVGELGEERKGISMGVLSRGESCRDKYWRIKEKVNDIWQKSLEESMEKSLQGICKRVQCKEEMTVGRRA